MKALLDVSVLIALIDPAHADHDLAHSWFETHRAHGWATCPLVENGALRIVSQQRYLNSAGSPAVVAKLLQTFFASPEHHFWPDDISLLDDARVHVARLTTHRRVTDSYLLALAVKHGGVLATLDRKLATDPVIGGREALLLL